MSCVWHEMWRPKRKRCEHCCVSLLAVDIDSVWWGVAAGSWCTGGTLPRNLPVPLPFVYFITLSHLPHPPPCPSISATIALWAIWSSMHFTPPLSLSVCLSLLCPHVSIPSWLLWPDIKVRSPPPSLPPSLPLSFFSSLHWLYISCAQTLFSNFCLCPSSQIYFCYFLLQA